ncbi:MAG TPA: FMN reductase, partial [Pseudomonas sp.]|nr:FMN reductase [Pseudomonas sp.]
MPAPVTKDAFRNAMSVLASAVNVVTTDGPAGRAGFTATAVCSVSDEPPSLLVCLNRSASVYDIFQTNDHLCVNTLTCDQQALSNLFG